MPPTINASTSGRTRRRRGRLLPAGQGGGYVPPGGVADGMLPAVVVSELPTPATWGQMSRVDACAPGPAAANAGPDPAGTGPDAAGTGPGPADAGPDGAYPGPLVGANAAPAAVARANVRVSESGSQFPPGWRAPTPASRPLAVGRWLGSLARQRSISGRTVGGTWSRLGVPWTTRYSSAAVVPVPNGPSPVAANARTAPRLKMSLGGPTSFPMACSGDMNPGDPTTRPA